ncbi:MAG: hypothetical protein OIF36_05145 [Alphaproteobacteria bacterium]|nr:hypothetical protein [Alphaproteobacteria bacterium]
MKKIILSTALLLSGCTSIYTGHITDAYPIKIKEKKSHTGLAVGTGTGLVTGLVVTKNSRHTEKKVGGTVAVTAIGAFIGNEIDNRESNIRMVNGTQYKVSVDKDGDLEKVIINEKDYENPANYDKGDTVKVKMRWLGLVKPEIVGKEAKELTPNP